MTCLKFKRLKVIAGVRPLKPKVSPFAVGVSEDAKQTAEGKVYVRDQCEVNHPIEWMIFKRSV